MKLAEIRKMDTNKLIKQVDDVKLEITELKRGIVMGESTNVRAVRNKRKQLSRMLSVIGEKLEKEKI
ncbi:MAG TPA: 50S ribosomal protein L29 [Candidatus Saccharimonadales bacterium]|jgi:ribosomal protein L29|nr:50S ribosomal protein L29 [Candidatus Saccharimonadales bacterium]